MSSKIRPSLKLASFADSVFPVINRLAAEHQAVNLSQGFPDFPAPDALKDAVCRAVQADINQYPVTCGTPPFRAAIAREFTRRYGVPVHDDQITVGCGSTEAMMATLLATVNPGDEVIVFEPFYENYGPGTILAGGSPRYVRLRPPDWRFDPAELAAAFNDRTKAIVINTPNNPTGKVYDREELQVIADLCQQWDVLAISDEIYEHIVYSGHQHVPIASLPGMAERTVTVNGLSKAYSVTGWRIGWAIAPLVLSPGIRKMHEFLTVAAPAPMQEAGVVALGLPDDYYTALAADYERRRDVMLAILERHGFTCYAPSGAYYLMADVERFGFEDDFAFARHLAAEVGVASIPGSSFFSDPAAGRTLVRFCFSKRDETLTAADERLAKLAAPSGR
ncbi:MAG: pyridoxal phosphate-dependent aminotransferase [Vicinamibacterales bacterium]